MKYNFIIILLGCENLEKRWDDSIRLADWVVKNYKLRGGF
jgi:D-alanyl-D-alanine carboxypeptidase